MSIYPFNRDLNQCDYCGVPFEPGIGGIAGQKRDETLRFVTAIIDLCVVCAERMGLTTCGYCGRLVFWTELDEDYACEFCHEQGVNLLDVDNERYTQ